MSAIQLLSARQSHTASSISFSASAAIQLLSARQSHTASLISFSASAAIQLLSARQSHTASSISSSTAVAHAATLRSCARLVTRLLLLCCSCRHSALLLLRQAGHTALFPPPLAPLLPGSYAAPFLSCKGLFHTSSPARQGSTLVHNGNPSFATHFSLRAACRSQVREEVRAGRPFFGLGGGYCRGYPLRERTWHSELSLAMLWQGGCWLP